MKPIFALVILLTSCTRQPVIEATPEMQRIMMESIADSVVKKTLAINPQIIDRAITLRINALLAADSVLRKSIDGLGKEAVSIKSVNKTIVDSINSLQRHAMRANKADFIIDTVTNVLSVRWRPVITQTAIPATATITYTTKQLSDKMKVVETTLSSQVALNAKLIADTSAKSKRIIDLEKANKTLRSTIDSLAIMPDTAKDFKIEGRILRIRRP